MSYYQRRLQCLILAYLYLSAALTNAIELNPLKNLMKDNNGQSNGSNRQQRIYMDDASTGTITQVQNPQEKQPTSCNELMAKAVVVASEEKEAAVSQRDAALTTARAAEKKAGELSVRITSALNEAKNATIEYEAIRLMSNRLVDDARKSADERVRANQEKTEKHILDSDEKHRAEKEATENDFAAQKKQMVEQIEEIKAAALREQQALKDAALQQKEDLEAAALHQKQQMEAETAAQKQKMEQDADALQATALQEKQEMEKDVTAQIEALKQKLAEANAKAEEDKKEFEQKMDDIQEKSKEEIAKTNADTDERIKNMKQEMDETINLFISDSNTKINEAYDSAAKIERNAERRIDEMTHNTDATIRDVHRQAKQDFEKVQAETLTMLEEQKTHFEKGIDDISAQKDKIMLDARIKQEELQGIIDSQKEQIKELKLTSEQTAKSLNDKIGGLKNILSVMKQDLSHYKQLHDYQGYFNTTLAIEDSKAATQRTLTSAKGEVDKRIKIVRDALYVMTKPYRVKAVDAYYQYLEPTVLKNKDKFLPLYMKYGEPIREKYLVPFSIKAKEQHQIALAEVEKQVLIMFDKLCAVTQIKATELEAFLSLRVKVTPEKVHIFLQNISKDAAPFLYIVLKFLLITPAKSRRVRSTVLSFCMWLLLLPFRVIWFFCPLKFLVGESKKQKELAKLVEKGKRPISKKKVKGD